jgi:hypothetical protein
MRNLVGDSNSAKLMAPSAGLGTVWIGASPAAATMCTKQGCLL